MTAGRENLLHFHDSGVCGGDLIWGRSVEAPARNIEQTPPLFPLWKTIATLDSAPPPLTKVMARAKEHQLVLMLVGPTGEAVVVFLWGDPASPRASEELTILGDEDLGIGAVDLFGDDALATQAR